MQAISADPLDKRVVAVPDYVRTLHPLRISTIERMREMQRNARSEKMRRGINICVALFGLLIGLPIMALTAMLIKATSRGPIFYKQQRVGIDRRAIGEPAGNSRRKVDHGGRLFTIYKFRTMHVAGDNSGNAQVWASPEDPRTTRVGRILRKYRIDELPQLVNVLKGDMNVVGPRPEQPRIFEHLRGQIEEYPLRQQVLPGITGLAQITLAYDSCVEDVRRKVRMDIRYLQRRCALEDLRIMARTIPVLVFRRGAW